MVNESLKRCSCAFQLRQPDQIQGRITATENEIQVNMVKILTRADDYTGKLKFLEPLPLRDTKIEIGT